jgi:hypothetical protein
MSNNKQYCFHFLEHKLQEKVVDFDAAASGNEDELAKLIAFKKIE